MTAPTNLPIIRFSTSWELYEKIIRNIYRYPDDSVDLEKEDFNARRMISDWLNYEDEASEASVQLQGWGSEKTLLISALRQK